MLLPLTISGCGVVRNKAGFLVLHVLCILTILPINGESSSCMSGDIPSNQPVRSEFSPCVSSYNSDGLSHKT